MESRAKRCNWCGTFQGTVWVHGHGQCGGCGTNIEPCCGGDSCQAMAQPRDRFQFSAERH